MAELLVRKTRLAKDSRLHALFTAGDFLDCYAVQTGWADKPIAEVAQRLFVKLPGWINALLAIRDLGVAGFGLKTTANLSKDLGVGDTVEVGDYINFFQVRSISSNEIILGEDDLHLDFRISVYRDRAASGRISLATWVRTHNRLGKVYLGAITPFHVLIVTSQLRGLARHRAQ